MKPAVFLALLVLAGPATAAAGGPIGTLPIGAYACERPGDAAGPVGVAAPDEGFDILTSSTYAAGGNRGSYLRTGESVVMTSGPKQGQKFRRVRATFLRKLGDNGAESDLRCIRRNGNNG